MLMSFSLFKDGGIMKGVRQEGNGKHENCAECQHITHSNMKNNNRSCALKKDSVCIGPISFFRKIDQMED